MQATCNKIKKDALLPADPQYSTIMLYFGKYLHTFHGQHKLQGLHPLERQHT